MKNATHNRIRRLLPFFILLGMGFSVSPTAYGGVNRWTSSGPEVAGVNRVAIDPTDPAVVSSRAAALWNISSERGLRVEVVGWWATPGRPGQRLLCLRSRERDPVRGHAGGDRPPGRQKGGDHP